RRPRSSPSRARRGHRPSRRRAARASCGKARRGSLGWSSLAHERGLELHSGDAQARIHGVKRNAQGLGDFWSRHFLDLVQNEDRRPVDADGRERTIELIERLAPRDRVSLRGLDGLALLRAPAVGLLGVTPAMTTRIRCDSERDLEKPSAWAVAPIDVIL